MRRVGYIIEEIVEPSNMEASFRQVLRGSKRKRSRQGCYLLAHKPEVLEELVAQIASGTFRVKDYREREIIEGGKLRRIQVIPMKDRIAVLGGFLFHTIWEANSRYIFVYSLLLMPYCAAGIHDGLVRLAAWRSNRTLTRHSNS